MSTQVIEATNALIPAVSEEQIQTIETSRNGLLTRAQALVINSPQTKQIAWDLLNGISELKKSITEDFSASKKAAHAAWKAICAQENGHLENLNEPDKIVRQKLSAYEEQVRREQAEAERKAREAAEAEQKRLQAEAEERARQEQERLRKEAEDARIAEALKAEAAGKSDVAAAILEKPIEVATVAPVIVPMVTPVIVPKVDVKVEGQGSMVEEWDFVVENEDLIPSEYFTRDDAKIRKVVRALKGATRIPGVKAVMRMVPRTSGRR